MFRKPVFFVFLMLLAVFLSSQQAAAQSKSFNGNWEWKSRANAQKEQSVFWVDIKQKGDRVTGQYSFAMLVDGENDGSDSSYVLFVGTAKGDTLTVEFDPNDIHGIYEEHARYKRPRSPSTATMRVRNGKLQWTLVKGKADAGDLDFPKQMTLNQLH